MTKSKDLLFIRAILALILLYKAHDFSHKRFKRAVAADQVCARKSILQITNQALGIIPEQDGSNASLTLSDENRPKGGLPDRESNVLILAPSPERARRHSRNLIGDSVKGHEVSRESAHTPQHKQEQTIQPPQQEIAPKQEHSYGLGLGL